MNTDKMLSFFMFVSAVSAVFTVFTTASESTNADENFRRSIDRKKMLKLSNLLAKGFFNFHTQKDGSMDESIKMKNDLAAVETSKDEHLPPFLLKARDNPYKFRDEWLAGKTDKAENDIPPFLIKQSMNADTKWATHMPPFVLEQLADQVKKMQKAELSGMPPYMINRRDVASENQDEQEGSWDKWEKFFTHLTG